VSQIASDRSPGDHAPIREVHDQSRVHRAKRQGRADPSRAGRQAARAAVSIGVGAALLLSMVAFDGRPTVFTDTDDYFSQGRATVRAAVNLVTHGRLPFVLDEASDRLSGAQADEEPIHNQNGARSAYYGALLFALQSVGTLWALAAAQSLAAAWLVHRLWRRVQPDATAWRYVAVMAGLAAATSLPAFAGFAMPDVFAGFAVIAAVVLTVYGDRVGRGETFALWAVLAASANFHSSNALVMLCVAAAGAVLLWRTGAPWRRWVRPPVLVGSAIAVAVAAGSVYGLVVKLRSGDTLRRPPFLTARVLADGPGRRWLPTACDHGAKLALCAYRNLPLTDSEDILWSDEPDLGVFNLAEFRPRERLSREETGFVLRAVAADPIGQVAASLGNVGGQMLAAEVDEPVRDPAYYLTDPYWITTNLPGLILGMGGCGADSLGCKPRLSAPVFAVVHALGVLASLGLLLAQLARPGAFRRVSVDTETRRAAQASALILLAVLANAAVCGALSGPFARYEARLIWLVPVLALLVLPLLAGRGKAVGGNRAATKGLLLPAE